MLVQACLGISIDGARKQIHLANPLLPTKVDEIQVRRLRIGDDEIDFAVRPGECVAIVGATGNVFHFNLEMNF